MPAVDTSQLYSAHPHLAKLDKVWGTEEGREFINRLICDTRGGERRGFEPEHASVIARLLLEHDKDYPEFDDSFGGIWWLQRGRRLD